jgi:DNA-binding response OmpR family regulator
MSAPTTRKLIFVAEDDKTVRTMVRQALETKGYEVVEAGDGLQALQMIEKLARPPSLFIFDVMMPLLDGFGLAKRVRSRKELGPVPIIFLTAKTSPDDVVKGIQSGARHYMTKPFSVKDLLTKIEKTIG